MYDSWGSSWAGAWGISWLHQTPVITIDTHDDVKRIEESIREYKRKKEELHETILRAFEDITGESSRTVEEVEVKAKEIQSPKLREILRPQINEYEEVNKHLLMLSKSLQDREMDDIAFILSVL